VLLARPENAFSWSSWEDPRAALEEMDALIQRVADGAEPDLQQLRVLFAPTGPIQEVSLSGGWCDTFLELAARLDAAISR
jgi:hypothetical protein